jgi:hypothetical protein
MSSVYSTCGTCGLKTVGWPGEHVLSILLLVDGGDEAKGIISALLICLLIEFSNFSQPLVLANMNVYQFNGCKMDGYYDFNLHFSNFSLNDHLGSYLCFTSFVHCFHWVACLFLIVF